MQLFGGVAANAVLSMTSNDTLSPILTLPWNAGTHTHTNSGVVAPNQIVWRSIKDSLQDSNKKYYLGTRSVNFMHPFKATHENITFLRSLKSYNSNLLVSMYAFLLSTEYFKEPKHISRHLDPVLKPRRLCNTHLVHPFWLHETHLNAAFRLTWFTYLKMLLNSRHRWELFRTQVWFGARTYIYI